MAQYLDPIVYSFRFSAITHRPMEPLMKETLLALVKKCKPWILKYMGYPNEFLGELDLRYAPFFLDPMHLEPLSPILYPYKKMEECWQRIINPLEEGGYYYWNLSGGALDIANRKYFSGRSSKLGKEYEKFFHRRPALGESMSETCRENAERICELLSCPNEKLQDIRVLRTMVNRNYRFLNFFLRSEPACFGERALGKDFICLDLPEEEKDLPCYSHAIVMELPRVLIGPDENVADLQMLLCDSLKKLGAYFPYSFGTVAMDIASMYFTTTYYARDSFYSKLPDFYSRHIPGYAWGMLINRQQAQLMKDLDQYQCGKGFHEVQHMENGNVYFQLNDDMECMTREESIFLRNVFAPYLPPHKLGVYWGQLPPSLRLGCTPDQLRFEDLKRHLALFYIAPPNDT